MADATELEQWKDLFPLLDQSPSSVANSIQTLSLEEKSIAFHQGDSCNHYLLVLEGSIKVLARSPSGREIVLYRVQQGGSCVLTTSCLLAHSRYPAEGITETPVRALAIPASAFHQGLAESEPFRTLVFKAYGERLSEVIALVESISFEHINQRLARYLLDHARDKVLQITHQSLATELGSAREVISRHLKDFEQHQWITQQRGEIKILDETALSRLTNSS